ncbi:MAG: metallophosphatase, partial [Fibrobacteria bacterium]|nr:metallophosphatase [Fibrobacteria bacterium]
MKIKPFIFIVVLFFCLFVRIQASSPVTLIILHTSDLHGHLIQEGKFPGVARLGALFKNIREKYPNTLVLDAGDAVSGTPVSTIFKGTPVFEVMNEMGYDIGLLGNHEFDYGWKQIDHFKEMAKFPILCANVFDTENKGLGDGPFVIYNINGLMIGVIGVITEDLPNLITPNGNRDIKIASVEKAIKLYLPELQEQSDIIILLSHLGFKDDQKIARACKGIDIIIGGHSN